MNETRLKTLPYFKHMLKFERGYALVKNYKTNSFSYTFSLYSLYLNSCSQYHKTKPNLRRKICLIFIFVKIWVLTEIVRRFD